MPFLPNAKSPSTKSRSRSDSTSQPQLPSSEPPSIKMSSSEKPSRSSKNALKRLTHEVQDLQSSPRRASCTLDRPATKTCSSGRRCSRDPRDPASPYHGGLWLLSISVPPNYPLAPPKVSFITPICHPNVHFSTGEICLTLLSASTGPPPIISAPPSAPFSSCCLRLAWIVR